MGKIYTAVNHNRLAPFLELTQYNYNKAIFLDYIAFSTNYTNYNLPNSNSTEKWATRTYEQLNEALKIPKSTLKNYMKIFCDKGWVKRVQKKSCNHVKLYFRATDNLLTNINRNTQKSSPNNKGEDIKKAPEKNFNHTCTINNTDSRLPYINRYKEQDINIITPLQEEQKCGKDLEPAIEQQETKLQRTDSNNDKPFNTTPSIDKLFNQIGERLSNLQKRAIWGALSKFYIQHKKQYAKSSEFVAWVCFAILNPTSQLKGCETITHQINRILKIARSAKGFNKPYGFHTHWDIGKQMKKNKERKAANEQVLKTSSNNNLMQTLNGEPMSFSDVIAKKSKNIWQDDSELKDLKCAKGKIERAISAVSNEIKTLPKLYSAPEHKELLKKLLIDSDTEKKQFQSEYKQIISKIKVIEEGISIKKSLEWDTIYEDEVC